MPRTKRCTGSRTIQALAFGPTEHDDYPGGTACVVCTMGVLAIRGTPRLVMDERLGYEVWVGEVEVHNVPKEEY